MKIPEENNKTEETFNTIPHYIKKDFYNNDKNFSVPEKNILLHLRMIADVYGVAHISSDQINQEVFVDKMQRGTINKHLTSLRNQGYITYQDRKGRGGVFKVQIDKWLIKNRIWTTIHKHKNTSSIASEEILSIGCESEEEEYVESINRMFGSKKGLEKQYSGVHSIGDVIGSTYNNKEKEKENDIHSLTLKEMKTAEFDVNSEIDYKLKYIAEEVGEESVGFIFGFYRKYGDKGLKAMERTVSLMKDAPWIDDRGKWFNKVSHESLLI